MGKTGWILVGCVAMASPGCADGSDIDPGGHQGGGGAGAATSSSGGSGGDAGQGGGDGGAGSGCDYDAPAPCDAAALLEGIDGDQNSDVRTANGDTSKWFHIYVAEAVTSVVSYPQLSYTASLVSPAGMDYDLFVHTGDDMAPDCMAPGQKATGSPEQVSDTWGDTISVEDGTWLALEVRHVSGDACGPEASWTLTIAGHTNP